MHNEDAISSLDSKVVTRNSTMEWTNFRICISFNTSKWELAPLFIPLLGDFSLFLLVNPVLNHFFSHDWHQTEKGANLELLKVFGQKACIFGFVYKMAWNHWLSKPKYWCMCCTHSCCHIISIPNLQHSIRCSQSKILQEGHLFWGLHSHPLSAGRQCLSSLGAWP